MPYFPCFRLAEEKKEEGNQLYKLKSYKDALAKYSEAIGEYCQVQQKPNKAKYCPGQVLRGEQLWCKRRRVSSVQSSMCQMQSAELKYANSAVQCRTV